MNGTKHFTNVFVVEQAEFGDTDAAFEKVGKNPLNYQL